MKYKLLIAAFLAGTTMMAQAKLIDVVSFSQFPVPDEYIDVFITMAKREIQFFDSAVSSAHPNRPPGWVSLYGSLDGGEFFFTDLFEDKSLSQTQVSWDFGGTPYFLRYITLSGRDKEEDAEWVHVYQVPFKFQFADVGESVQLNPNGTGQIFSIAFYGKSISNLPESGTTACLLGLSLVSLASLKRFSSFDPTAKQH
jgi:hypothetical protein